MCIIFVNQNANGKAPDKASFRTAFENNPDGVGFMWFDGRTVKTVRDLFTFNEAWKLLKLIKQYPYACHLRYRTKGDISQEQCHPFVIGDQSHKVDSVYMMHNGTFRFIDTSHTEEKSDSQIFAERMTSLLVWELGTTASLFNKSVIKKLENKIGPGNKIVFMRETDGLISIANKSQGFEQGGIWYSNKYSLIPSFHMTRKRARYGSVDLSKYTTPYNKYPQHPLSNVGRNIEYSTPGTYWSDDFSEDDF